MTARLDGPPVTGGAVIEFATGRAAPPGMETATVPMAAATTTTTAAAMPHVHRRFPAAFRFTGSSTTPGGGTGPDGTGPRGTGPAGLSHPMPVIVCGPASGTASPTGSGCHSPAAGA